MKAFIRLAAALSILVMFSWQPVEAFAAGDKQLGIAFSQRLSFARYETQATYTGKGIAELEAGTVSGDDVTFTVNFTELHDPVLAECLEQLDWPIQADMQLIIWGFPASPTVRSAGGSQVTITLGRVTGCGIYSGWLPGPARAPIVPADGSRPYPAPPPPDPFFPAPDHLPAYEIDMVDAPYGGQELTPAELEQVNRIVGDPGFTSTILGVMARRAHGILTDARLTEEQKESALRDMARPGLSEKDYQYLRSINHDEPLLRKLPGQDQAKLRFLINDEIITDKAVRNAKIDGFIASALFRESQLAEISAKLEKDAQRQQQRAYAVFGSVSAVVLAGSCLWFFTVGRRKADEITIMTVGMALLAALAYMWAAAFTSPHCGFRPSLGAYPRMDYCVMDVMLVKHRISDPSCPPGVTPNDYGVCWQ
jgi:hypothetical protein